MKGDEGSDLNTGVKAARPSGRHGLSVLPVLVLGLLSALSMALLIGGCDLSEMSLQTPTTTPTVSPTPTPTSTPNVTATPTPTAANDSSLVIWTVEAISPMAEGETGKAMRELIRSFEVSYPEIEVKVILKKESGRGSVLDFLRTAGPVAPSIMPDVVILNNSEIPIAREEGLIKPLDARLSQDMVEDLVPVAREACTVDDRLVGVPFQLDVEHLVYNTNRITTTPTVWTDVLSSSIKYAFPAKGQGGLVNDAFLIQYLSLGGKLHDDEGNPRLDLQPLQEALEYYRRGADAGVFPPTVLEATTTDYFWPTYLEVGVDATHVKSSFYLANREMLQNSKAAPIPTKDGELFTVARGWSIAMVTEVPSRQQKAVRFIQWFVAPDNNAYWSTAAMKLPTRYAAYSLLGEDDEYWQFTLKQLEIATPIPAFHGYDRIGRVLQQAVQEVLSGESTPEEAATAAVEAAGQ